MPIDQFTPDLTAHTRIAFEGVVTNQWEIFTVALDGSDLQRITYGKVSSSSPTWSPDGSKIAYAFGSSHPQLYVMNAGGSQPRRLTDDTKSYRHFSWSPDGLHVVYAGRHDGETTDIHTIDLINPVPIPLTKSQFRENMPAWSPDGHKIAFNSDQDGYNNIYVMNTDGSNPIRLTNNTTDSVWPVWSPDGHKIAYQSRIDEHQQIFIMNADGSQSCQITHAACSNGDPSWSPDGKKITFESDRDGFPNIYTMHADGSEQTRLLSDTMIKTNPSWSPYLPVFRRNKLVASSAFARPAGQALVDIRLYSNEPMSSLQFTVRPVCDGQITSRALFNGVINHINGAGWKATSTTDTAGAVHIQLFNINDMALPAGSSVILTLVYDITPEVQVGAVVDLQLANVVLSSISRTDVDHTVQHGTINIRYPGKFTNGAIGDQSRICDEDVHAMVSIITGEKPYPAYGSPDFFTADVNGDDDIDITDVVEATDQSLNGALKQKADRLVETVKLGLCIPEKQSDGRWGIPVIMQSEGRVAGLQIVITATASQIRFLTPRLTGSASKMMLGFHIHEDDLSEKTPLATLSMVIYSAAGHVIEPGQDTILLLPVDILREPQPTYPHDSIDLLGLIVVSDCQGRKSQGRNGDIGLMWTKVSQNPLETTLHPNHPEPLSSMTYIPYDIDTPAHITIMVLDTEGYEIVRLVDEQKPRGRYVARWNGRDQKNTPLSPGEYVCRMTVSPGDVHEYRLTVIH